MRDAGTLKPSGRSGVEINSIWLLVLVIAVARLEAFALVRGSTRRLEVIGLIVTIHGREPINFVDISPIN